MKNVTIRQALQNVADYPQPVDDKVIDHPVSELVARTLFDIANSPDQSVRGSMGRANKARKLILDRMVGKRRAGTSPQMKNRIEVELADLTGGVLNGPADEVQPAD